MMLKQLGDYYHEAINGNIVLTKFLNLEEIKEIQCLNRDGLKVYLYGGYEGSERMRAIVQYVDYDLPVKEEFKISIYHCEYDNTYQNIGHRNILGSIMSLGIERNTFGDIYLNHNHIYLFITEEIENYLITNLPMIGHQKLEFRKIMHFDELINKETVKKNIQVSSMRLDAIIARTINISRSRACDIIEEGNVSIHHLVCKNTDHLCHIGDMISIRKFGCITIIDNVKITKKERLVLLVGVNH
jgi:RNA binding protein S4